MRLYQRRFTAMACPCMVQVYHRDEVDAEQALEAAIAEVRRIETRYSRYRDDSIVSQINRAAGTTRHVTVDPETAALLDYAATACAESDGRFDITSGVLRRVWNLRGGIVPSREAVAELLPLIGWQLVEWQAPEIRLPLSGMELDFGGFGKEYAVDRAAGILVDHGIAHGLVDLGGDVHVVGPHADGSPWRIGIRDPRDRNRAIARIALLRGAIATSGDYERAFVHEGRSYSHLLDPRSGWPVADNPASVSVLAERCLLAGTASTVAMLHGEEAERWLQALGLPWLAVGHDGGLRGSGIDDGRLAP